MRKILPYTVRHIGGPEELKVWKQGQEEKQAVWESGRVDRYQAARERSVRALLKGIPEISYSDKREISALKQMKGNVDTTTPSMFEHKPAPIPKESMITSIYNKVLTWFATINFEPKGK